MPHTTSLPPIFDPELAEGAYNAIHVCLKLQANERMTLITDRGDLVLDNKTNAILPWHKTGYVFIKRESQDAVAWVSLGGVTSPVTTANR